MNRFKKLIDSGKITSLEGLKKTFRILIKKTHPDSVGSDRFIREFINLQAEYDEAAGYFKSKQHNPPGKAVSDGERSENNRYLFFHAWHMLETIELEWNKTNPANAERTGYLKKMVPIFLEKWKGEWADLFSRAFDEYYILIHEKYKNTLEELRKPLLIKRLRPVMFNLCNF